MTAGETARGLIMKVNVISNPDTKNTVRATDYEEGSLVKVIGRDEFYVVGRSGQKKWLFPILRENDASLCCGAITPAEVVEIAEITVYPKYIK